MNKTYLSILAILMFCLSFCLKAQQDKLLFLNGKEIEGTILEQNNYEFSFKDIKGKKFTVDSYRLFSFSKNNQESVVYKYDTLEGNFLKEHDMKMFVYGERGAYQSYNSTFSNIMGFAAGGFAGYFMHKDQAFIYIATPLVYTAITLPFPTSVKQKKLTDQSHLKEDEFLRGYERVARSKRTQNALKSSILGTGLGFLVSLIVNGSGN